MLASILIQILYYGFIFGLPAFFMYGFLSSIVRMRKSKAEEGKIRPSDVVRMIIFLALFLGIISFYGLVFYSISTAVSSM